MSEFVSPKKMEACDALQQMQDIAQRRAAAMEQHRLDYESEEHQFDRNTGDGEDEIDAGKQ